MNPIHNIVAPIPASPAILFARAATVNCSGCPSTAVAEARKAPPRKPKMRPLVRR